MLTVVDKIYWSRIALGVVAGVVADLLFHSNYVWGILLGLYVYLASYYVARFLWKKRMAPTEVTKLYSAGIGGFFMLFLFFWILLFSLNV